MSFQMPRQLICLLPAVLCAEPTAALQWPTLPPSIRMKQGPPEAEKLRLETASFCGIVNPTKATDQVLLWKPGLSHGWEVASATFDAIQQCTGQCYISFPSVEDPVILDRLANAIQSNSFVLGGVVAEAELYPRSPAPLIRLTLPSSHTECDNVIESKVSSAKAVRASTASWVEKFLARYRLCPYTASLSKAAVGLSTVQVEPGPISIQVVENDGFCPAVRLVSSFWNHVAEMLRTPEADMSTVLLVDASYDADFMGFVNVCDNVIEQSIQATGSSDVIGRAWFHPLYAAADVGHETVVPGHAVPHALVENFISSQVDGDRPGSAAIANVNDLVRKTPHATINILRRSQLSAAGLYEAGLEKKPPPNSIYVRNVMKLIGVGKNPK